MELSRREFVKLVTGSGIVLTWSPLAIGQVPGFAARETLPGRSGWNPAAAGTGRIDGVAKVTGAKLYASDFRAADLPGWPTATSHAILVRASDATHVYTGLDLARLTGSSAPTVVVTAADLVRAGMRVPAFFKGDLLCPAGTTPLYLGQPVALLLFATFDAFDAARIAIRNQNFVKFGKATPAVQTPPYGSNRFVRVAGPSTKDPDVYSPLQAGWVGPIRFNKGDAPVWANANRTGPANAQATYYGDRIRKELAAGDPNVLMLDRTFDTQSIDPMFLEPESGLAWFDATTRKLEMVVGVQSPAETAQSVAYLLGNARGAYKPALVNTQFAYVGGGFGGRDHTPFPLYVALAALFLPGRPVRLAHDRYQQFQGGIKRHAFKMRSQIGVDRKTGKILAFAADHVLDGGGLANFSVSVADVGATGAIGIYDIPKVDVTTVAVHSRGVTAGSMRGYGTTQTMSALEVLIDEAAVALQIDPIEFRRRNALPTDGRTMAGNTYFGPVRTPEILDKLDRHPIWQQRAAFKAKTPSGFATGTGLACVTKDYGSGADCSLATVELAPDGRISVYSDAVEMGTAIGTALANRVATILGVVADEVAMARVDVFGPLELMTSGDPYANTQAFQDAAARNPHWVPQISSPSSASVGAHISTQGAAEAATMIFRFGLWPAALELWGIAPTAPLAAQWQRARWQKGALTMPGKSPLPIATLAARAHERKWVTGAMVHGFNRWAWAQATFTVAGQSFTADLDALAVRMGDGKFLRIPRRNVKFPPTIFNRFSTAYSSLCGTVVRIEIERATGALRIAKAYSVVECGTSLVPEVVMGQMQGGFAMGVGQALLENLPLYEDGPGNGTWNLGQYVVARATDLPMQDLECEILPPVTPHDAPKGMAEVVMIPVIPAILNAIFDATGRRFASLPVTPDMLKGALT
ncbi:MAG: molybdopterin cofactor-binding domain-containing protein [Betaproteobacteria bacterium]